MIGAAFDVSRSTLKRTESYSEYKAQREAAPEDLIAQIPRIEELLDYYGIAKFKIPDISYCSSSFENLCTSSAKRRQS